MDQKQLFSQAVLALQNKELVAFPTETVYGLGAVVFSPEAVEKIFLLKKRPSDNPLIVHISSMSQLSSLASEIPESAYLLAERFWPGPLTLVLQKTPKVPSIVSASLPTVAIRMPSHPLALELIEAVQQPLVAPSANLSGKPSPLCKEDVEEDFGSLLPFILDGGPCSIGIESTVLNLTEKTPTILRPGAISQEELSSVLQRPVECAKKDSPICSPGMRYRHYAPKAPIRLFFSLQDLPQNSCYLLSSEPMDAAIFCHRSNFYSLLRQADRLQIKEICIYCGPSMQKDVALLNRVFKAAGIYPFHFNRTQKD